MLILRDSLSLDVLRIICARVLTDTGTRALFSYLSLCVELGLAGVFLLLWKDSKRGLCWFFLLSSISV